MPTKKVTKKEINKDEFAIIETGGKQYQVSAGDSVVIEKLSDDHKVGDVVTFDKVLLVDNGSDTTIGTPYISGAKVTGTIKEIGKLAKVSAVKYKAKSNRSKKFGHRQPFCTVAITSIK